MLEHELPQEELDEIMRSVSSIATQVLLRARPEMPPEFECRENFIDQVRSQGTEEAASFLDYSTQGKIRIMVPMLTNPDELHMISMGLQLWEGGKTHVVAFLNPRIWAFIDDIRHDMVGGSQGTLFFSTLDTSVQSTVSYTVNAVREIEDLGSDQVLG
jgi:hypothetical protein